MGGMDEWWWVMNNAMNSATDGRHMSFFFFCPKTAMTESVLNGGTLITI